MSMMGMLIVCVLIYFNALAVILMYAHRIVPKYGIAFFIIMNSVIFLGFYINDYQVDQRFSFQTFVQISPFTFTALPFTYLMKEKIRQRYLSAVAFLCIGMLFAMLITPQFEYLFSFKNEASMSYTLDTICHLNCSLFGIYLMASGEVKLTLRNLSKAIGTMHIIVTCIVIMNFLFHKNYFGMGPYSDFSIYMFDFFDSYWVTLFVYYLGIAVIMSLGFGFGKFVEILKRTKKKEKEENIIDEEIVA